MCDPFFNEKPLISVIVPVYNKGPWVKDALDCICKQTYTNLDIIIVDDGSTDSSLEVCRSVAEKDKRIQIAEQDNGGPSRAKNAGIELARGDYIIFVDADDMIATDHIERLYDVIRTSGSQIAVTNLTDVLPEDIKTKYEYIECSQTDSDCVFMTSIESVKTIFYQGVFDTCAPAKLYPRQLWDDVRFPNGYVYEELSTIYKVFLKAKKVGYFYSEGYLYRTNPTGINHSVNDDNKSKTLNLVDNVVEEMKDACADLEKASRCFRASFCFHLLLNSTKGSLSEAVSDEIKQRIRQDRLVVLFDAQARKKTRIACLLSFFGFGLVQRIFDLRKRPN